MLTILNILKKEEKRLTHEYLQCSIKELHAEYFFLEERELPYSGLGQQVSRIRPCSVLENDKFTWAFVLRNRLQS